MPQGSKVRVPRTNSSETIQREQFAGPISEPAAPEGLEVDRGRLPEVRDTDLLESQRPNGGLGPLLLPGAISPPGAAGLHPLAEPRHVIIEAHSRIPGVVTDQNSAI
jgi:hypothetical protein